MRSINQRITDFRRERRIQRLRRLGSRRHAQGRYSESAAAFFEMFRECGLRSQAQIARLEARREPWEAA